MSKVFDKHNIVARAYHNVQGSGPSKRKEIHEMVHTRMTGRKFTPKFEKRTHLKAFVLHSSVKEIVEEILNNLSEESEPRGMILIKVSKHMREVQRKAEIRY
jgi:nitrogen regulatory protein PII